jgi:hypothetical protein
MPVTTRAAALRSQADGDSPHSQDQVTSTVKKTRKRSPRRNHKPDQPVKFCVESEIYSSSQRNSADADAASTSKDIHQSRNEDVVLKNIDTTLDIISANQSSPSVQVNKGIRIQQKKNE